MYQVFDFLWKQIPIFFSHPQPLVLQIHAKIADSVSRHAARQLDIDAVAAVVSPEGCVKAVRRKTCFWWLICLYRLLADFYDFQCIYA